MSMIKLCFIFVMFYSPVVLRNRKVGEKTIFGLFAFS